VTTTAAATFAMDDKSRADFLHGMAQELKDQADNAHHDVELLKSYINQKMEPIDKQIDKLKAQKRSETSEFEAELNEKKEAARKKYEQYTHFAVAIGVSFSLAP
jgi:uncharacterized coiled-coil DUF342 family protein